MNALRSACSEHEQLDIITAKLSISLLRHSDILPMDRAFYEAGIMCRKVGWNEMSMMFLNRYLDVVDAIEERNPDMLATSDFVETDIPYEIELPDQPTLPAEQHEKIKEHVLTLSMKQAVRFYLFIHSSLSNFTLRLNLHFVVMLVIVLNFH